MRNAASRALKVLVACLLVVTIPVALDNTRMAHAGSTTFRTFQHNAAIHYTGAINHITLHESPLVVTGQELCRSGYNNLKLLMEGNRGYRVFGIATVTSSGLCGGQGGQINLVGSLGTWSGEVFRQHYASQAPGDGTNRGLVCMKSSAYLLSWWLCSTHITPTSVSHAENQLAHMKNVGLFINDRAVIIGGDLQRRPWESGVSPFYSSFVESDQTMNSFTYDNDPGDPLNKKIDYIFSIGLRTDAAFGVARVGCGASQTGSDHCFVHGTHRFLW